MENANKYFDALFDQDDIVCFRLIKENDPYIDDFVKTRKDIKLEKIIKRGEGKNI